ncbi:MAG TPA: tetraacyldisaccharide 4'-kinase [Flavobacterium sp.]|jgi:tetraacyldisaccharide 4'-kinase
MKLLRKILFPFSLLYGGITWCRNRLYDKGILRSYTFPVPVIAVGNLSVGGTGKTPQVEYLIRLLSPKYKIATLSRGYKRTSKGFILADATSDAAILGDEPFQYYQKFPGVWVAVDADRKNGIGQLLSQHEKPEVVLLDDAYQHRKVKAGFYILLTAYNDLYADDFILPVGNLRESSSGAQRADCIIVTKCPKDLSKSEQEKIKNKLKLRVGQPLYFSSIAYDQFVLSEKQQLPVATIKSEAKVLLAGIAKPVPFFDYLKNEDDIVLTFPDHHHFTDKDITAIRNKAGNRIIITTEKDYVRLKGAIPEGQLFYLPIQSQFIEDKENFDLSILAYLEKNRK